MNHLPHEMRHITTNGVGDANVMQITTGAVPMVGADDVLIRVAYAGVNRPDVIQRQGNYAPPPSASPILGLEVSGDIVAIGANVRRWHVGDAVCALTPGGGYAEYCAAPAAHCLPIPTGMSMLDAAGLPENFFTVWVNVFNTCALQAGEKFLVHGGSSGIGLTAIQLANAFGAEVFTTAGNADKAAFCKNIGAHHVFNYKTDDWATNIASITQKKGVNVILDMVGGSYIEKICAASRSKGATVLSPFSKAAKPKSTFDH